MREKNVALRCAYITSFAVATLFGERDDYHEVSVRFPACAQVLLWLYDCPASRQMNLKHTRGVFFGKSFSNKVSLIELRLLNWTVAKVPAVIVLCSFFFWRGWIRKSQQVVRTDKLNAAKITQCIKLDQSSGQWPRPLGTAPNRALARRPVHETRRPEQIDGVTQADKKRGCSGNSSPTSAAPATPSGRAHPDEFAATSRVCS